MQFARRAFLALLFVVGSAEVARAQQVCSIIAHYFVNAPTGFINERGEQLGPGYWRSNLSYPNASCYIRERNGRHSASCIINSGGSVETITNYGKLVEHDVDSCLRQIPNGSDYDKDVDDDNENGVTSHTITWENDADDADYEIRLSGNKDNSDGHLYNSFSVSWEKN